MRNSCLSRRAFLGAAAALPALRAAAPKPLNIVFIVLDDLGYGDFGCYGRELSYAECGPGRAEGTRFTDCYAGGTVCAPSRSTLMTGYHTGHGAVRSNAGTVPLLKSDVTVAEC